MLIVYPFGEVIYLLPPKPFNTLTSNKLLTQDFLFGAMKQQLEGKSPAFKAKSSIRVTEDLEERECQTNP